MAKLDDWSRRPVEEANLFNPPFICSLICEFLKDFAKRATPAMAKLAEDLIRNGLTGRIGNNMAKHWKILPEDDRNP